MTHASICLATTDIRSKYNLVTAQFCEYFVKQTLHKSNKTPTWCNTVQVLFLQSHSTCFGRQAPIIRSIKKLARRPLVQVFCEIYNILKLTFIKLVFYLTYTTMHGNTKVKLCTSQIWSTYVQLRSFRFEHKLVFSAVSFNLRQENQTVRGSSLASLLFFFRICLTWIKRKRGEKCSFSSNFWLLRRQAKKRYQRHHVSC